MGIENSRSGSSAAALKVVAELMGEIAKLAARGDSAAVQQLERALASLKSPAPQPKFIVAEGNASQYSEGNAGQRKPDSEIRRLLREGKNKS